MNKETFLQFRNTDASSLVTPSSSYLGLDAVTNTSRLQLNFKDPDGALTDAVLEINILDGKHKEACEALAGAMASGKPYIVIADDVNGEYLYPFTSVQSLTYSTS